LLPVRLGIAGSGDASIGDAITGGVDSEGGKVSALLGVGVGGAGAEGGSAGRGATSGTGAGSGSGGGSIWA
jgi:hypothetical protein